MSQSLEMTSCRESCALPFVFLQQKELNIHNLAWKPCSFYPWLQGVSEGLPAGSQGAPCSGCSGCSVSMARNCFPEQYLAGSSTTLSLSLFCLLNGILLTIFCSVL